MRISDWSSDVCSSDLLASRIGLSSEATWFDHDTDLLDWTNSDIAAHGRLDCLLVDEAQLLRKPQVWQLSEVVDRMRILVLCYGLRTDFRGELLEGRQYLLAWAGAISETQSKNGRASCRDSDGKYT